MPSDAYDTLHEELAALLVTTGPDVARRLRENSFPLAFAERQTIVTRDNNNPDAWGSSEIEVNKNALAHAGTPLYHLVPLLSSEMTAVVRDCAAHMLELTESKLPFFSPFEGNGRMLIASSRDNDTPASNFESNAVDWTTRHLLLPALYEHLRRVPRLQRITDADARSFAADVLQVATANDIQYLVTIPIAGIRVGSRIEVADASAVFRRLTSTEQGDLLTEWGITSSNFGFITLPLVALEFIIPTERNAQNPDARETVAKWLCALLLQGYDAASYRAKVQAHPSWLMPFSMNIPVTFPSQTNTWSNLTSSRIGRLLEKVGRLARYSISDPRSERDLALHRFCSGTARANHVDGILDFVIALESLLLPYDEDARRGDLGYRFRMHGAYYLSRTRRERTAIARQLTDLYSLRSRLVHGGKYPSSAEIDSGWNVAKHLSRLGLDRAVTDGFPSAAEFKAMLLGA
jgi:Apea-like HEPN